MTASTFTYQARIAIAPAQSSMLDAYAELFGMAERTLFAQFCAGEEADQLKSSFCAQWGLTARQYNAISAGLKGKIDSVKERRIGLLKEADHRIAAAIKVLKKLAKAPRGETAEKRRIRRFKIHQKKRRLATLEARRNAMDADHQAGTVRIAFGSKKLFRGQPALQVKDDVELEAVDNLEAQLDWREGWRAARSSQFLVLGSKDETAGCQGCVATIAKDGSLTLRVRLPDSVVEGHQGFGEPVDKHVVVEGVRLAFGHDNVVAALNSYSATTVVSDKGKSAGQKVRRITGTALTYRFVKDLKGWRVFVSVAVQAPAFTSKAQLGAIGVDVNADHLAVAETDRFGNLVNAQRLDAITYGKTEDRSKAIYGDIAVAIVSMAKATGKPVVIEKLDFAKKKAELEAVDRRRSRMLSALSYAKAAAMLKAACFRMGVTVMEVNPAYTSVIGAINFARRFGISIHQGAALAIARRGLGMHENPVRRVGVGVVPTRNGGHVAFDLPVRNRSKHVWTFWAGARRRLSAALAEHYRCAGKKPAPPSPLATRVMCANRSSEAGFLGASQQNCSADDIGDVPF
jgi:IS605 OrfB family transposase